MDRFNDIHSEPNNTPLRRDAQFRIWPRADGRRDEQLVEGKAISMSADGSIDCAVTSVVRFYHCGHPAPDPIGCACAEVGCANTSCKECSKNARCARCFKPLCLEHVHALETPPAPINLCRRCKADILRGRRWKTLGRAMLKPFIRFDSHRPNE